MLKVTEIPPCKAHSPHPHSHPLLTEGAGRYCCTRCGTWASGRECHSGQPPKRKAAALASRTDTR